MPEGKITSGDKLVAEFLESIGDNPNVDANTLAAVKALQQDGKLTKNRLLASLQGQRSGGQKDDEVSSD